ncbi:hypothetical protein [Vibrio sp. 10N.239.312.D08]|uniref:hypothetical protein n=1 Tax=Vibrio sp. 10N.239.312.D08 TaxID=3229978 RepID=UPI003552A2C0
MSHIVQGKLNVQYTSRELLIEALAHHGNVLSNDTLFIDNGTRLVKDGKTYDIVLASDTNSMHRIGYKESAGMFKQYQENYGEIGRWTSKVSQSIQDLYVALEYRNNLQNEGYEVSVAPITSGGFEIVAQEESY